MKIRIKNKRPWFWFLLEKVFGVSWDSHCLSFGTTIYAKNPVPQEVFVHELVHLRQQGYSKLKALGVYWRYWRSPDFRMECELEAYREQHKWIKQKYGQKIAQTSLFKLAERVATQPYFQGRYTREQAERLINK